MPPPEPDAPVEPHVVDPLETRPAMAVASEVVVGPGRLLAVILLIALAFGGGVAVDQAAWRGSNAGPFVTPAPLPTSAVRPPSTSGPGSSLAPGSAIPGTAVPGTPGIAPPTPRVTPGPTIGPGATVPPFAPANISILWDALKLIEEHFVRRADLNPTDLTYGAVNGLVDALGDPGHTVFLTPEEVKSENEALSGQITGIGVYLGEQGGAPFIQSVVSGSPAARAGLLSGDRIIAIDGTSAENLSVEEIARLVRGPEGTQVTLTIIHAHGNSPINVTITRAKITVPAVTWAMVPGSTIADIRIAEFSSGTTDQFTTALRGARQAGARGIIVDLRNNPGGFVDDAVGVASQLLPGGTVYIRKTADGQQIPVPVKAGGIATDIPLAVLIDYGSASSAEITAGAIQAAKRGPLIGTRTYGTGTVLNTFDLPDGSAVRLGVEEWLTPSGQAIFPNGIQPDQVVELTGDTRSLEPDTLRSMTANDLQSSGDDELLRAIQVLSNR
jgi:carboxyl-terminal processing protease